VVDRLDGCGCVEDVGHGGSSLGKLARETSAVEPTVAELAEEAAAHCRRGPGLGFRGHGTVQLFMDR
jgi:hypothetical protein